GYSARRQLHAQPLHQGHQRALGGSVIAMSCLTTLCRRTRDENDPSIVGHCPGGRLSDMEHAVQVGFHGSPPLTEAHLGQGYVVRRPDAMVAHKAVESTEP